jgi:Family of unknown function (DUF5906)
LRICGQHGVHISNAAHLTGRFNGHLQDAVFLFSDEALFAADKQHESILKTLITETELLVEVKFQTPRPASNLLHILMASNDAWIVPASYDERRFLVLDVADTHRGDAAYFTALHAQLEAGGAAAMLHDLLRLDLRGWHPRSVPPTAEMAEQVLHSFDTLHRWWTTVLSRGFVWRSRFGCPEFLAWARFVSTELLSRSYAQWCADTHVHFPQSHVALGLFLRRFYPASRPSGHFAVYEAESVDRDAPMPVVLMKHPRGYRVGDLDAARECFTGALNLPVSAFDWARGADEP